MLARVFLHSLQETQLQGNRLLGNHRCLLDSEDRFTSPKKCVISALKLQVGFRVRVRLDLGRPGFHSNYFAILVVPSMRHAELGRFAILVQWQRELLSCFPADSVKQHWRGHKINSRHCELTSERSPKALSFSRMVTRLTPSHLAALVRLPAGLFDRLGIKLAFNSLHNHVARIGNLAVLGSA